jgi:hypothetical protein
VYDPVSRFHVIECRYCGQVFKTRFGRRRYCTDQCNIRAHPCRPRTDLWTYQEVKVLRQLAGKVPPKEIAARVGRTHRATREKARRLGVALQLYGEIHHVAKYSDALVEEARTMYDEGLGPTAIAKQLGIPLGAVQTFIYYKWRLGPPIEYYF